MFFKVFHLARYDVSRQTLEPDVRARAGDNSAPRRARFVPPFGSLQLAYQGGSAHFDDGLVDYRTLRRKLSWAFEGPRGQTSGLQTVLLAEPPSGNLRPALGPDACRAYAGVRTKCVSCTHLVFNDDH